MCGILCIISKNGTITIDHVKNAIGKLVPRGPDDMKYIIYNHGIYTIYLAFTRLAIMDTSSKCMQPFVKNDNAVICNGEIYNYKDLAHKYNVNMNTDCDCEIILPVFEKIGFTEMIKSEFDAEFAMVIYEKIESSIYAARDRYGVRPLFYGYNKEYDVIGFASEMKALHYICDIVQPVIPNQIFKISLTSDTLVSEKIDYFDYNILNSGLINPITDIEFIKTEINRLFTKAVKKRLIAHRPLGFLLSGGLDSSLIVSIAARELGPDKITCFSIGVDGSPDVEAAKKVIKYLGIKNHHIIPFDISEGFKNLNDVIYGIESYDTTTCRASTPQWICAKYINENTDIKVLLIGEGSDEIHGGYIYYGDAPNHIEFHKDRLMRTKDLYAFDCLRADRTLSRHGIECRVPHLDFEYVNFIFNIDPKLLMHNPMEKYLLRESFIGYLPNEILYRRKEAFSDGVSSEKENWYRSVQKRIESLNIKNDYTFNKPETSEALYYRSIFSANYPGSDDVIPYYWLPNFQKEKITDPSATILTRYKSN